MVENIKIEKDFQQTEVGVIPSDWEVVSLDEVSVKIGSGKTPTGGETVYKKEGRPFVRSQNVGWGRLKLTDLAFIDEETHQSFGNTEIELRDILLNITGASIGRSALADFRVTSGNVNQHVCIIRSIENVDAQFIGFQILTFWGQKQINDFQAGGNRQGLNFGQIKQIQIPLPPTKAEQTAIATALSDMDALIEAQEKLIEKKKQIKQGAMQELLRPKEGWQLIGLPKLVATADGIKIGPFGSQLKKELLVKNGFKVYGQENIFKKNVEVGTRYISKEHFDKLKSCELKPGDFIISMMGTIGKCMIMPHKMEVGIMDSHLIRLRLNSELIELNYLLHFFSSYFLLEQVAKLSVGGIMDGLSSKIIKSLVVPIPPKKIIQTEIAGILSDLDTEINQLKTQLSKYKQVKTGMMQELLTGKKRLV